MWSRKGNGISADYTAYQNDVMEDGTANSYQSSDQRSVGDGDQR